MLVTGHELLGAIREWETIKDSLAVEFNDSLFKFEDEEKRDPQTLMVLIASAEEKIAELQTAQAEYNLAVSLEAPNGEDILLAKAIKLLGGLKRIHALYKSVRPTSSRFNPYGLRPSRSRENQEATMTIAIQRISQLILESAQDVNVLRANIAKANSKQVDIPWLDADTLSARLTT